MNKKERLEDDLALIKKGTLELIGEDDLKEKLLRYYDTNKPLVIKFGLDPSAPDIHLGHIVVLQKIRQFQSLGHKAIVIIGDFTGRIGDPTGKNKTRKQLSERQVLINADTYKTQLLKVLDPEQTIICFNSEWLDKISLKDMIEFMSKQSLFRMLEREGFKKRVNTNETIYLHELLYPMLQGLDSLNIEADVELGGMDQKFNILMGRDMQNKEHKEKQVAIFMPLLEGLDGVEKMSKSLNNYVGVSEDPNTIFEKMMTLPDHLISRYYELLTDMPMKDIEQLEADIRSQKLHPKKIKEKLALEITKQFYSKEEAEEAKKRFVEVFSNKKLPDNLNEVEFVKEDTIVNLIVKAGFAKSNSEARRLIMQKGVQVNQKLIEDFTFNEFKHNDVLQVGKNKFVELKMDEIRR